MVSWSTQRLVKKTQLWVHRHKRQLFIGFGALGALLVITQLFYPADKLLPAVKVDDVSVGFLAKKDATTLLDEKYKQAPIALKFGNVATPQFTPLPADIGLEVQNQSRIEALQYPWYMRLVPTSLFWYGALTHAADPTYNRDEAALKKYIEKNLGNSCNVAPINANAAAKNGTIVVIEATAGGTCKLKDVEQALVTVTPKHASNTEVVIPVDEIPVKISTQDAEAFVKTLTGRIGDSVAIKVGGEMATITVSELGNWLDFDNKNELLVRVDSKKAQAYLLETIAPKVAIAAGTTKVTTRDFRELSRTEGATGRTLHTTETAQSITNFLTGKNDQAQTVTKPVAPRIEYTRTYSASHAGISALIAQYADDNPGTFGIQMIELTGKKRRAGTHESRQFITASTYKLFIAYSTLKRIESDEWKWSDHVVSGQNVTTCFNKMISNSDNPCAEALYKRIGYQTAINEVRALGLHNTVLDNDGQKTTAGDLAIFLGALQTGTIDISAASRNRLLDAMKQNVFRNGIPAGIDALVANKVGFLNGLLHDAAIVYSPKGTYVLVVMSDGSSWGAIAELTKKIEALR